MIQSQVLSSVSSVTSPKTVIWTPWSLITLNLQLLKLRINESQKSESISLPEMRKTTTVTMKSEQDSIIRKRKTDQKTNKIPEGRT